MLIKLLLEAGLGNQLFMIFAILSYSIDTNIDFTIYTFKNMTYRRSRVYWESILENMKSKLEYIDDRGYKNYDEVENSLTLYKEPVFNYKQIPLIKEDTNIKGYFQSYKYFQHNYNEIMNILNINEKIENVKNKYNDKYLKKKTIAIHFRIGDYIGLQGNHCIKRPEYFCNALNKLIQDLDKENIEDYDILYYCQKCDNNIILKYIEHIKNTINKSLNFVKISDNICDWEQILLMSLSNHFIISNSSFSWFGAYFCKNPNKLVYYPSIWFGPLLQHHNTSDMCPKEWIKIIE